MRLPDDYMGEMLTKNAFDREVELLFAGTPVEGGRLSNLAPVVETIRTRWTPAPSESEIAHFARSAAVAVNMTRSPARAVTTPRRRRAVSQLGLTPRLATLAMAVLLMSGTAGMAMAANGAIPGDALYGLDRVFERVGIGSGSSAERLDEAVVIATQGRSGEALAHGIEALSQETGDSSEEAAIALIAAAEDLVDTQDTAEAASAASDRVTALLTYIADNIGIDEGTDGREFGQGVAQLARDIGEGDDPTGAPNPAVAPAPGQGQTNEPDAGAGNGASDGNGDSSGNGQVNGNGQDNPSGNGNGQDNPSGNGNGQGDGSGSGEDNVPPVESPSVTAPGSGSSAPEESPAATAPGRQNKP
ncbi:MAG: hypothetical protein ACRDXF_05045 [Acidimicrobiia bacterium]